MLRVHGQGSKTVLSSYLGQVDFPDPASNFSCLPHGQGPAKLSADKS